MNLSHALQTAIEAVLNTSVRRLESIGGGCIANACCIYTTSEQYFLKFGSAKVAQTFTAEAEGLRTLRHANTSLCIPQVLAVSPPVSYRPGFLLLEWLPPAQPTAAFWEALGTGLAELHRHTTSAYGFHEANFIGASSQYNQQHADWPTFFRTQRLEPQIQWARASGKWNASWDSVLQRLYANLSSLLPALPPASLLHGDLWNGNVLATQANQAALIDPAIYYGDREADMAMTELFGGFALRFYDAYQAAWPLEPDYPERRDLYNLYHLLNHLNLFGSSYTSSVAATLKQYA